MEETIKQSNSNSKKEFETLLNKDWGNRKFVENAITTGVVSEVSKKFVFIDLGLKAESAIPIQEFIFSKELDKIKVGSTIEVLLEKIENKNGDVITSREKARKVHSWKYMEKCFEAKKSVVGNIVSRVKGGYCVDVSSCLCFLPGSQVALRPLNNSEINKIMKEPQTFDVVKLDKRRGNIVLSRRSCLEKTLAKDRDKIIKKMKVGDIVNGTVKNLTEWGAFIDLQGVDSLLHITDISWRRINKPAELLSIGQPIRAKIIKIEEGTNKISLGVKQLTEDPYKKLIGNYEIGKNYPAVVTNVQDYGCFARLEENLEGLIHQSELSWLKKTIHPSKVLSTSQKIQVQILDKDIEKRRLSLSYKNTLVDPWVKLKEMYKVSDKTLGTIKNITDYGMFVSIKDSELDGLIHYKDLSYRESELDLEKFEKNQQIEFVILEINQEKEKIRLGCKQLQKDPFEFFMNKQISVGNVVTAIVDSSSKNGIYVYVENKDFSIFIKKNQLAKEPENQRPSRFARRDRVDCMIISLEKDKRQVTLSIKALEEKEQKLAVKKYGSPDSGALLGEILGPLLNKKKDKKK